MPLGGVDTGCTDLETSGLLGYSTIFNTHVPRRGPINLPVFGMSVGGKTWVLCDEKQIKLGYGNTQVGNEVKPVIPVLKELKLDGVETAKNIHYWGHYPVADIEFDTDAPVSVGVRAWSPFYPGDVKDSMIPAAVFEVHVRNTSASAQKGTFAFSFPGPDPKEAGTDRFVRKPLRGGVTGVEVNGKLASYAVGVIGRDKVRMGGELGADGSAWANIATALPATQSSQPGSSAAVDFSLAPGQENVVRFVLTWYAPTWNGIGYNWGTKVPVGMRPELGYTGEPRTFTHMYAKYYTSAAQTAQLVAKRHPELLSRILAWQQEVYTEQKLPVWLRESLVNILYLITEDGMWAQKKDPIPAWAREEDGLFGLNECPRECPQIECIPCSFYGSLPLVYFFPDLALSTLRGYKGYQDKAGAAPWIFGGFTGNTPFIDFASPTRGYQITLNGPCYVDMFDRYLMCYPDKKVLAEFYPSIKKCVTFTMSLNRGPDGEISMPDRKVSVGPVDYETEWFEFIEWYGMVAHVGGIHIAMVQMAERMAEQMGDTEFVAQCRKWIGNGRNSLEGKMWNGSYYLNEWDQKSDKKSDLVFAYQLDGEWMSRNHGLTGVFQPGRVTTTLETIKKLNVPPTKYGAINYTYPDGRVLKNGEFPLRGFYKSYDFFSPELMMLGMTYMYDGQKDFGIELTRRCMENIICEQANTWDMPNIVWGDTGERGFGADYYQNLMLWALPAAIDGQSLDHACLPGGLVDRVIRAAKRK